MARMQEFEVPGHMQPIDVAKTFSAYLQGPLAFDNALDETCQYRNGPYRKEKKADRWQLDTTNDYWLHVENGTVRIGCRHESQEPILDALVSLFMERYLPRRDQGA